MPLKVINLCTTSPWDIIECPVCGSREFSSIENASAYCDICYAEFKVKPTSDILGFVVECQLGNVLSRYLELAATRLFNQSVVYIHREGFDDIGWYTYIAVGDKMKRYNVPHFTPENNM